MTDDGYYHDRGEKHSSEGKYEPPVGREDREDYDRGWEHTRGQIDSSNNTYRPPIGKEDKDVYDSSWESDHDNNSSSGGCFLTTACVKYSGLPDDCSELETMRKFRDEYIRLQPNSSELLQRYSSLAPTIVIEIEKCPNRDQVFRCMLENIRTAVQLINAGDSKSALEFCLNEFSILLQTYVNQPK
jgi:hypothetical protein